MQNKQELQIGEKIRAIRKDRNLTQSDFAENGISSAYLSLIENGHRRPTKSALEKIAKLLGVEVTQLEEKSQDALTPQVRELIFTIQIAISQNSLKTAEELLANFPEDSKNSIAYLVLLASLDCEQGNYLSAHDILTNIISSRFEFATLSQKMEIVTLYGETSEKTSLSLLGTLELYRLLATSKDEPIELQILISCLLAARLSLLGEITGARHQLEAASKLLGRKPNEELERNLYWTASNIALVNGDFADAAELTKSALRTLGRHQSGITNLEINLFEIEVTSPETPPDILARDLDLIRKHLKKLKNEAEGSPYAAKLAVLEVAFLVRLDLFSDALISAEYANSLEHMATSEFVKLQLLSAKIHLEIGNRDRCRTLILQISKLLRAQPKSRSTEQTWNELKVLTLNLNDLHLLKKITTVEIQIESQLDNLTVN